MNTSNPSHGVPTERLERDQVLEQVQSYAARHQLVPPLSMEELRAHAEAIPLDAGLTDYIMVLLNNEVWRDTVATIPYERRLLLLPQCLRHFSDCPAEMDSFGLLCEECGRCAIGALQARAEALGYVVLVAEGSTVVSKLLEGGKVDAVVGVSCLNALEKSFPHMAAEAIPGLAIPLFADGCIATEMDVSWVEEAIALKSADGWKNRLETDRLREVVDQWFSWNSFPMETRTEQIAYEWLLRDGKRWRPFLLACTYSALKEGTTELPDAVRRLGLAVECFHKASLVHDDIEDADDLRYGEMTLHKEHGVPVALNAGDLLVGEGYRWIASVEERTAELLRIAADNHRRLCLGQGEELYGLAANRLMPTNERIEIFRKKTAPAFGVSLQLGALAAGANMELCALLQTYSESLGIGYQIRDDLEEFEKGDAVDLRASILLSIAVDQAEQPQLPANQKDEIIGLTPLGRRWLEEWMVTEKAHQLVEHYKNEAIRALNPLQSAPLKSLLRRVTTKMLGGV